jgi:serine/threonine-protein kinase
MTEDTPHALKESLETKSSGSQTDFAVGELIGGRYRVMSCLGRGGMGVVYKVEQVFLGEQLALKTLLSHHISDTSIRRFQLEGKATFGLDHPNLISVSDLGILDDGTPFLVMEFIKGQTLADRLRATGRLQYKEAAKIFARVCFGLAYAHDKGIVHRDIKPSNLMLTGQSLDAEDCVKVMDFGIAKFMRNDVHEAQALTKTGEVIGSPLYMSPEQCGISSVAVDYRSDIYSLGCVFFECLTGAPPFIGETSLSTLTKHLSETPPTLKEASLGIDFPPALEAMVAKMLAKSPDERYQDLGNVALELSSLIQDDTTSAMNAEAIPKPKKKAAGPLTISKKTLSALFAAPFLASAITGAFVYNWCKSDISHINGIPSETTPAVLPMSTIQNPLQAEDAQGTVPMSEAPFSRVEHKDDKDVLVFDLGAGANKFGQLCKVVMHDKAGDISYIIPLQPSPSGEVVVPPGTKLGFSVDLLKFSQHPQWLLRFRPHELKALRILGPVDLRNLVNEQDQTLFDESLVFASQLNDLEVVDLTRSPITMAGLNEMHIEQKPKLTELILGASEVDGRDLARKRSFLFQLHSLDINRMPHAKEVLAALKGSANIQSLGLQSVGLTDADLDNLVSMPNLASVSMPGNQITDQGLIKLIGMKHITGLWLADCPITMAALPILSKMPHLNSLQLPKQLRPNDSEIKRALPRCSIGYQ